MHNIDGFIAKVDDMIGAINRFDYKKAVLIKLDEFAKYGLVFMPMSSNLHLEMKRKRFNPQDMTYAYIETDYFGGSGEQNAWAKHGNKFLMRFGQINKALSLLGVNPTDEKDCFDVIGLGKWRDNDEWIKMGNRVEIYKNPTPEWSEVTSEARLLMEQLGKISYKLAMMGVNDQNRDEIRKITSVRNSLERSVNNIDRIDAFLENKIELNRIQIVFRKEGSSMDLGTGFSECDYPNLNEDMKKFVTAYRQQVLQLIDSLKTEAKNLLNR